MRRIAHISDLHFGAADPVVAERLIEAIDAVRPDLVVVSGDLTQRARKSQFREARSFLEKLRFPQLIVPGNHDVPLYNVFDRFVNPLENYQRYITKDLEPFHSDDEIAVAGINTSRSLTIKGGRISRSQIDALRVRMRGVGEEVLKVIVTHHPFDVPDGEDLKAIVGRAERAMPAIASCGADVFLAGHLHVSHVGDSTRRYDLPGGYSALIMQAGTACSSRGRGEENSFNVLEFQHPLLCIKRYKCGIAGEGFRRTGTETFTRDARGWARL